MAKGANVNAKTHDGHSLLQPIILEPTMWFELENNILASKINRELARLNLVKILVEEGNIDLSMKTYAENTGESISLSEYAFLHDREGIALYLEEKMRG